MMTEIAGNRWWQRSKVDGGRDRRPLAVVETRRN